jgi:adenosylcobinamide-GDP ribazoletransferase
VLRRFTLAVTFLTGLPLPVPGEARDDDLWGSMAWYPLVGVGLGFVGWLLYGAATWLTSPLVAAALVVVLLELFTRALHLDGLMDTCDGYFSGASRERALEIMKDSRSGAMGVFGAIAVILVKVAALASLSRLGAFLPLVVGWAAARTLPPIDLWLFPYARAEGTGAAFARGKGLWPLVAATVTLVVAAVGLGLAIGRIGPALVVATATLVVALAAQAGVARRLGGLTGDVYGMGIELAEATALVAGSAMIWHGWLS